MNPILNAVNGMKQLNQMTQLISQLKNGNPQAIYNQMLNNNPQFKNFVEQNKGKSAEQIANENGIDLNQIKQFLK